MNFRLRPFPGLLLLAVALVPWTGCFQPTPGTKRLSTELGLALKTVEKAYDQDLAAGTKLAEDATRVYEDALRRSSNEAAAHSRLIEQVVNLQRARLRQEALAAYRDATIQGVAAYDAFFQENYMRRVQPKLDELTERYEKLDERLSTDPQNVTLYREAVEAAFRMLTQQRLAAEHQGEFQSRFVQKLLEGETRFMATIDAQLGTLIATDLLTDPRQIVASALNTEATVAAPDLAGPWRARRNEIREVFDNLEGAYKHLDEVIQTDAHAKAQLEAFFQGVGASVVSLVSGGIDDLGGKLSERLAAFGVKNPDLAGFTGSLNTWLEQAKALAKTEAQKSVDALAKSASDAAAKQLVDLASLTQPKRP